MKLELPWNVLLVLAVWLWSAPSSFALAQEVDRDAWMQVETRAGLSHGMTPQQVEVVLGKPSRSRITRSGPATFFDLEYRSRDDTNWMVLNFMDGRHLFSYSVARLGLPSEDASSTQAWRESDAWSRVEPGMTLEEVEAILGTPTARSFASSLAGQEVLSAWLYDLGPETDGSTGMVMFGSDHAVSIVAPLFPVP